MSNKRKTISATAVQRAMKDNDLDTFFFENFAEVLDKVAWDFEGKKRGDAWCAIEKAMPINSENHEKHPLRIYELSWGQVVNQASLAGFIIGMKVAANWGLTEKEITT